jgi:hypothetical protein
VEEKKDRIDFLLSILAKSGQLTGSEKLLDRLMQIPPESQVPEKIRQKTIRRLQERQRDLANVKTKLAKPEKLQSLGEYLKLLQRSNKVDFSRLAKLAQSDVKRISLLEQDRISPLDFSLDQMARIINALGLTKQAALHLIKKSHQLFKLQPQITKASARYDQKQGTPEAQLDAMDSALKELVLRSATHKPGAVTDPEIEDYLRRLEPKLK